MLCNICYAKVLIKINAILYSAVRNRTIFKETKAWYDAVCLALHSCPNLVSCIFIILYILFYDQNRTRIFYSKLRL